MRGVLEFDTNLPNCTASRGNSIRFTVPSWTTLRVVKLVYLSYSDAKEDRRFKERLKVHLAPLIAQQDIQIFDEEDLPAGAVISDSIDQALNTADCVLLLLSPDYLAEKSEDLQWAKKFDHQHGKLVRALLIRSCLYEHTPAASVPLLHDASQPLRSAAGQEVALDEVVRRLAAELGITHSSWSKFSEPRSTMPLSTEIEFAYLRCLSERVGEIRSHWHEERLVPPSAHKKARPRFQGLRNILQQPRRTFHRHAQDDYAKNPALADLDLSVRAGFGKRVKIKNLLQELQRFNRIVILGDPGSGKSVCLRHLAYDLAHRELARRQSPHTIPVLVEMGSYAEWRNREQHQVQPVLDYVSWKLRQDFAPEIEQAPHNHPVLYILANLAELLGQGRVTMIFDALDEMSPDGYQERYQALKAFMLAWQGRNSRNRFIYSCRSLDYDPSFSVDEVLIDPFDRGRIRRYLRQHLSDQAADVLYRHIADEEPLFEVVSNPYFLHALTYVNRGRSADYAVPATRGELMRLFVEETLEREAQVKQQKELAEAGGLKLLINLLEDVGFALQRNLEGGTSVATGALKSIWDQYPGWLRLLRIARRARILGRRDEDPDEVVEGPPPSIQPPSTIDFVHHRIQEHFAAGKLVRLLEAASTGGNEATDSDGSLELDEILDSVWWQETVILAIGIAKNPEPILARLLRPRQSVQSWLDRVNWKPDGIQ